MSSWRDTILKEFIPNISKLTLVSDIDYLLTEEKLVLKLNDLGFELMEFNDSIEFRYIYESRYRAAWDRGEKIDLVLILRQRELSIDDLPYDLLQSGRKLSFNLGDLFPSFSYPIIEKIDRSLLDLLYTAQSFKSPERIGDNSTKDFILHYVFGIDEELIINEVDLLRNLLRLHYGNLNIPVELVERLAQKLSIKDKFQTWPLSILILEEEKFFAFLQERWPIFLSIFSGDISQTLKEDSVLKYAGPAYLPFEHQDIKIYIDNLFLERKLIPISVSDMKFAENSWVQSGIVSSKINDEHLRISRLFDIVEQEIPVLEARYSDWITFALKWAELSALIHSSKDKSYQFKFRESGELINSSFFAWLIKHYTSLMSLPPTTPAMLHHVPRRLARDMAGSKHNKIALIVVDGLALDQWVTLRQILQEQDTNLTIRESATFAWIPTITSVSRQSIFSGKAPLFFSKSINSTAREEKLWELFWEDQGLSKRDVKYRRSLGHGNVSEDLDDLAIHLTKKRVLGLVVDTVDKIMHGMQLGAAGMHNQIKQWCQKEYLSELVGQLLDAGYGVWLTADHGNIQCEGKGRPSEGAIAETRGERVRVYPTQELRSQVSRDYSFSSEWTPVGLPDNYFPLVANGYDAFVAEGETIVGHGGASIEEVIVPLIKFERKEIE